MIKHGPEGPEQWVKSEQKEGFSWGKCIVGWVGVGLQGKKLYDVLKRDEVRLNKEYEEILIEVQKNPLDADKIMEGFWARTFSGVFDSLTQEEERKANMFRRIDADIAGLSGRKDKWERAKQKTESARGQDRRTEQASSGGMAELLVDFLFS